MEKVLAKLLKFAPAVAMQKGIKVPDGLIDEISEEITGESRDNPQQMDAYLSYLENRHAVSDEEFRRVAEIVFKDRRFRKATLMFISALQTIVHEQEG